MEENSNLKVRSDLYSKSLLRHPISSTTMDSAIPLDLFVKRDANFNNNDTSNDLNKVPHSPIIEPVCNLSSQPSSPKDNHVNQSSLTTEKMEKTCDTLEGSFCNSLTNDSNSYACSPKTSNTQERKVIPSTDDFRSSSPMDDDDDDEDEERIDVVTPDEVKVVATSPLAIEQNPPPLLDILTRNRTEVVSPDTDNANKNLYQKLQNLNGYEDSQYSKDEPKVANNTSNFDSSPSPASSGPQFNSPYLFPSSRKLSPSPTESPPPQLPYNAFGAAFSNLVRLQDMNPFTDSLETGLKPSYNPSLYAANLPPHLLPWIISSQLQNYVQYQNRSEAARRANVPAFNGGIFSDEKDQQPLDLSSKKLPMKSLSDEELVSRVLEVKPSTRGRKRADNSKRTYTENELHAALRDISSGKLGTRRAAVMYGIPRSTLRNKVYKLSLERDKQKKFLEQSDSNMSIVPDSTATHHRSNLNTTDSADLSSCEAFKCSIRNKMTEKLDELIRINQTFLSGGEKQKLLDSSLSYLFKNIQSLALNPDNKTTISDIPSSISLYPQLQEVTHKIIEERFEEEIKRSKCRANGSILTTNGFSGDIALNIPTYPNVIKNEESHNEMSSSHASISSPAQNNLKDMIAQIINQNILNDEDDESRTPPSSSFLPLSVQHLEQNIVKSTLKLPNDERSFQEQSKKRAKSPSATGGGKGSRPKRGKYRNYDRDNLVKAVQAVQSGEMSVHRAGSFYGVPHSTLEYKVKERHLNRGGRTKKDSLPTLLKTTKDTPLSMVPSMSVSSSFSKNRFKNDIPDTTTSFQESDDRSNNDDISVISVQPSPPKRMKLTHEKDESYSQITAGTNPFLSNPFPFWSNASPILAPLLSSQYQSDPLYASQMMRDLQEKLRGKASESRKNSPSPPYSYPNSYSKDLPYRPYQSLSNGGSVSPSPPGSPNINEGLLNSLLRKKIESGEGPFSWQLQQSINQQKESMKDDASDVTPSHSSSIVPPSPSGGLFTLNALLPSFLAARSSIAAAVAMNNEGCSLSPPHHPVSSALPLVTGAHTMPFVGQHLTETP